MRKLLQSATLAFVAASLAGCPRPVRPPPKLPSAPAADLRGASVYEVDAEDSSALIHVYRGGALARLGHNHVIASRSLGGRVWLHPSFAKSGFELAFPVASLIIDDPAMRRAAGAEFVSDVSPADAEGTRNNMLRAEVLDAERYPQITLRSMRVGGTLEAPQIVARITIRGVARDVEVPAAIEINGRRLRARGEFDLKQTQFGIKPFSIALGALEVQDRLHIKFDVAAEQRDRRSSISPPSESPRPTRAPRIRRAAP